MEEIKIKTPLGKLIVRSTGTETEYPGVQVLYENLKGQIEGMIACVEYDNLKRTFQTGTYDINNDVLQHLYIHSLTDRSIKIETNLICPKCGNKLYTNGEKEKPLFCQNCKTEYQLSDTSKPNEVVFTIPMEFAVYRKNIYAIQYELMERNASGFSYDRNLHALKIFWPDYLEKCLPEVYRIASIYGNADRRKP